MNRSLWTGGLRTMVAMAALATVAHAHSASDAYLDITVGPREAARTVAHGQWDIALRDLDFVLKLDDNGDGLLTWGEVRRHAAAIEKYALAYLHIGDGAGNPCSIKLTRQWIDDHADGAYAALFFDISCPPTAKALVLDYQLFFAVDPSHRGILALHSAESVATAVLSPENAKIRLGL